MPLKETLGLCSSFSFPFCLLHALSTWQLYLSHAPCWGVLPFHSPQATLELNKMSFYSTSWLSQVSITVMEARRKEIFDIHHPKQMVEVNISLKKTEWREGWAVERALMKCIILSLREDVGPPQAKWCSSKETKWWVSWVLRNAKIECNKRFWIGGWSKHSVIKLVRLAHSVLYN